MNGGFLELATSPINFSWIQSSDNGYSRCYHRNINRIGSQKRSVSVDNQDFLLALGEVAGGIDWWGPMIILI